MKAFKGELPRCLKELTETAKKCLDNEMLKDFLWKHTMSKSHYYDLLQLMKRLALLKDELVEW